MAKKFRGPELIRKIDEALDKGLARFIINTQSKLSASSPVDTGRLASSWFIGKDQPDLRVAPEGIGKPAERETIDGVSYKVEGTNRADVSIPEYKGKITMNNNWWISNNLPYARRAAFDPGYIGRRGGGKGDWFTRVITSMPQNAVDSFDFFLRQVK